jgi:hypothetical protein
MPTTEKAEPREDFLTEDSEIPGQRFCLLSFLSPENVLAKKELYYFEKFLATYEIQWKTKNLEAFLAKQVNDFNGKLDAEAARLDSEDQGKAADICRTSRARLDEVLTLYQDYLKQNAKEISQTKLKEAYDDFVYTHGKKVEDEFYAKNEFQTTVRGLKIRGSYSTHEEAAARAKKLQKNDTIHNVFVGEVGKWLPWDPSPSDVKEQEYAEEQLNTLMKSYKENEDARELFYNKNPDAKKEAFKGGEKKKVVSMSREEGSEGPHDSLFGGGIDLALQRKMEREAKKDE